MSKQMYQLVSTRIGDVEHVWYKTSNKLRAERDAETHNARIASTWTVYYVREILKPKH